MHLKQVTALDLPLKVNNPDKAIDLLGGRDKVAEAATSEGQLELRLRENHFHHPITSRRTQHSNIILKIELPKWALEKTDGDVRAALQLLKPADFTATPTYVASPIFRFREMADFQYYTGDSDLVKNVEQSILNGDLSKISSFKLMPDATKGQGYGVPPPRFSQQPQPFFYNYKQNTSLHLQDDGSGEVKLVNHNSRSRIVSEILSWGDPVPLGPPENIDKEPRDTVKGCIEVLKELFAKRPSYTRRALSALVDPNMEKYLKFAIPYVAYFYRSGPWRGAYLRYGVNPTTDRSLAKYQVEHFRIQSQNELPVSQRPVYTFDGIRFPVATMLQLLDVSEPFLLKYINSDYMRDSVSSADGWYPAETMAIIRRVLRAELAHSIKGLNIPMDAHTLSQIAEEAVVALNKSQDGAQDEDEDEMNTAEE